MAERSGNLQGIFNIGFMYETGDGVPNDIAKATQYFFKAAKEGHTRALERVVDYEMLRESYQQRHNNNNNTTNNQAMEDEGR